MIGKQLTAEEVLNLKEYSSVYVEHKENKYANGKEFVVIKGDKKYTQNAWGTRTLIEDNPSLKYFEVS